MDLLYKAQTRFIFHAHIKIKISAFYEDQLFDELFGVLEHVDREYNSYQAGSYIDRINRNAGEFVEVDDETIEILSQVIQLSDFFDGEYDITIMPLIRLWGFYKDEGLKVPSPLEIEDAKKNINYRNIEIRDNRVRIAKGQEIITGSFIKAYAIDKLKAKMIDLGINDAVVNAGGSTILTINNEAHPLWKIAVRNSDDESLLFYLKIGNSCYSTSSQSKTFLEIDNRRYGHIINPSTGMPSHNKHIGLISNSCMIGDIISTGVYNLTPDKFIDKIADLKHLYPELDGFIIDESGKITFTKGFEQYIIG